MKRLIIFLMLLLGGFACASNMGAVVGGSSADVGNGIFYNSDLITAAQNVGANGAVIKADTGVTYDHTGNGNGERNFAKAGVGTGAIVGMYALITGTNITSGYYEITGVDGADAWVNCANITATDDNADSTLDIGGACPIIGGGATVGNYALQEVFDDALNSTAANNVETYMTGNATIPADIAKDAGGGTASTVWHLYGCNSSYVRITPTRSAIGGGKANGLLDTSGMPTLTLAAGVEFVNSVDYTHFDGIYFTGNTATNPMFGTIAGDYQMLSNCVFANSNNTGGATVIRTDNFGRIFNCDFLATGGTAATVCLSIDLYSMITNCRFENASNSVTSRGIDIANGVITNCIFYDIAGIAVDYVDTNPLTCGLINCTFENVLTCVETAVNDDVTPFMFVQNIVKDCTTFINNGFSGTNDLVIYAAYNQINTVTNVYDDCVGELGFQDVTSDPLFISEANDDYNLGSTSPAKNSSSMLTNRGAMSDVDAGGGGGGVVGVSWN